MQLKIKTTFQKLVMWSS